MPKRSSSGASYVHVAYIGVAKKSAPFSLTHCPTTPKPGIPGYPSDISATSLYESFNWPVNLPCTNRSPKFPIKLSTSFLSENSAACALIVSEILDEDERAGAATEVFPLLREGPNFRIASSIVQKISTHGAWITNVGV